MPRPFSPPEPPGSAPANGRRLMPRRHGESEARVLARAFARVDEVALGVAAGLVCGLGIFGAAAWLLVKGGAVVGPTLALLAQYFPGFSVSWPGPLIGLLYGAAAGFVTGWALAAARNGLVRLFLRWARLRAERETRRHFLDYV